MKNESKWAVDMLLLDEMKSINPELDVEKVQLYVQMLLVSSEIIKQLRVRISHFGISYGKFLILKFLHQKKGEIVTPSEIADDSGVTRGTISGLIEGLEKQGYLTRSIMGTDRRMISVTMTAKGESLMQEILPYYVDQISKLMSVFESHDELKRAIEKLHGGLEIIISD